MPKVELLKPKLGLAKRLMDSLSDLDKCEEINIKAAYKLSDKKIRVPVMGHPLQIFIAPDAKLLHLYPEPSLKKPQESTGNFILFDPDHFFNEIGGFIRLENGEEIILGQDTHQEQLILKNSKILADFRLLIRNKDGALIFKSLAKSPVACISPLLKSDQINHLLIHAREKITNLNKLFNGKIRPLEPRNALDQIRQVNKLMEKEAYRPLNSKGKPGGVIELPKDLKPIILGDLHGKTDNLLALLIHGGVLESLEKGEACLIILGDAVHNEEAGCYEKMGSSLLIMDVIFHLKLKFPKNVFYLRGNHDSFSAEIAKAGIPQGKLWEKKLRKTRGKAYRNEMERYYNLLPIMAWSHKFIACHAAAPVSNVDRNALININDNPKLLGEVINNRLYRANRPGGYTKSHVKKLRNIFGLGPSTPFIVGHTPLSHDATLWENAGHTNHHTVISSSDNKWVGVVAFIAGRMHPILLPCNHLSSLINQMK